MYVYISFVTIMVLMHVDGGQLGWKWVNVLSIYCFCRCEDFEVINSIFWHAHDIESGQDGRILSFSACQGNGSTQ